MRIGAFAKATNSNVETVRFYMKKKLLKPTRKGSYWDFDEKQIETMEIIRALKDLNFSLGEIQQLFESSDKVVMNNKINHGELRLFQKFIEKKITEVDIQIANIKAAKDKLVNMHSKLNTLKEKDTFNL